MYKFDTVTENIELGSWKDYISSTECPKRKCRQHKVATLSKGKYANLNCYSRLSIKRIEITI